tara:strand:+ start:1127 stop:1417 length:291 start_codon:yes stop_codon:yes gene_type:complete
MKKGPLSKIEKQFIDNNKSMGLKDISKKLDRSEKVLSKYMKIIDTPQLNLFATKPERGVVIMTKAASVSADESRPKRSSQIPSRYDEGVIHTIKEK